MNLFLRVYDFFRLAVLANNPKSLQTNSLCFFWACFCGNFLDVRHQQLEFKECVTLKINGGEEVILVASY